MRINDLKIMEISRHWRLKAQRYRLQGSVCPTCGRLAYPPLPMLWLSYEKTYMQQTYRVGLHLVY